jgi:hypothetical protein
MIFARFVKVYDPRREAPVTMEESDHHFDLLAPHFGSPQQLRNFVSGGINAESTPAMAVELVEVAEERVELVAVIVETAEQMVESGRRWRTR